MATKLADDPATEAAKKALAEDNKVLERARSEYAERSKGKPTPTQEENDLAALGAHILEHEEDGSGPDPNVKSLEASPAAKPQGYSTRAHKSSSE